MSNIPISSLPIAVSLTGSETVPLVQGGTTKTATVSLINSQNIANIPAGGTTGQGLVKSSNVNYATQWQTISGFGTVQSVATGTGLTGGPITLMGTIALASISTGNVLANTTGVSAAPVPTTPSSVLDVIGSTQGDILYRSASGWSVLAPGNNGQILTSGGASANPAWSAVGSGTAQSVGLALPSSILTVSGSPVTTTGTLTGALATQAANEVWAGPATGSAATPAFRALVGADLPNPSATTLGGIQSTAGASNQWISSISTSGVPTLTQPGFSNLSGTIASAQFGSQSQSVVLAGPTSGSGNPAFRALVGGDLPNPSASSLGGVQSFASVSNQFLTQISTSGVVSGAQPSFSNLSGNAALAQLPSIGNNTILSNISGGSSTPLANGLSAIIDNSIASTQGDILYRNASAWVALPPGTSGQVLSTGGAAANPAWTTVTGTGTLTSVATNNGLTGGPITSSGTIGLATISTGNVLAYTGGGSGVPVATAPTSILDVIGSTEGDILYRGSSSWSVLAPGTNGQFLQTPGSGSTPSWASAVTGAGTSVNGHIAVFSGTSGAVIQDGGSLGFVNALASANVSGSASTTTGTISASSTALTLASALDFKNGQGIRVNHAGAASGLVAATGLTVTAVGTTGSTSYGYTVMPFTATGGYGPDCPGVGISNGNATPSRTNYNALSWTAVSGAVGYAIYGNVSGSYVLLALVSGTVFNDVGTTLFPSQGAPDWLPSTPQVSAAANWLVTSIVSGGGTTTLTLAGAATTAATGQATLHDDTVALQAALTTANSSNLPFNLGSGAYRISSPLTAAGPVQIFGSGMTVGGPRIIASSPTQDFFQISGTYIYLHDFNCQGGTGATSGQVGGAVFNFTTAGSGGSVIERTNIQWAYNGLLATGPGPYSISKNLWNAYKNVIFITNIGDSSISDNLIINPLSIPGATGAIGIFLEGDPGGARIQNNKINAGGYGYAFGIYTYVQTADGDLLYVGNSIEGFYGSGIVINQASSGILFGNAALVANQINSSVAGSVGIEFASTSAAWLSNVTVTANIVNAAATCIDFSNAVQQFNASANACSLASVGINVTSGSTNGMIGPNTFSGVTTQISDAASVCTYAAITTTKPTYP